MKRKWESPIVQNLLSMIDADDSASLRDEIDAIDSSDSEFYINESLVYTAEKGQEDCLKMLLDYSDFDSNSLGRAFVAAADNGHNICLEFLVDADKKISDDDFIKAFIVAVKKDNMSCVNFLSGLPFAEANSLSIVQESFAQNISDSVEIILDKFGDSIHAKALCSALRSNQIDYVEYLLGFTQCVKIGEALLSAFKEGHENCLDLWLETRGVSDLKDYDQGTKYFLAENYALINYSMSKNFNSWNFQTLDTKQLLVNFAYHHGNKVVGIGSLGEKLQNGKLTKEAVVKFFSRMTMNADYVVDNYSVGEYEAEVLSKSKGQGFFSMDIYKNITSFLAPGDIDLGNDQDNTDTLGAAEDLAMDASVI